MRPHLPPPEAEEGVIKFKAEHRESALEPRRYVAAARALLQWRARLFDLGLVGQDPARYGGAGFGNLTTRLTATGRDRPFLVTGTQTGGLRDLELSQLCVVDDWDETRNLVWSHGPILPSSESMTHGALYADDRRIRFIFHGHSPTIWHNAARAGLPITGPSIAYGTPEMAEAVRRLRRENPGRRVIVMGGHEDGVISWGASGEEAGRAMADALRACEGAEKTL